MPSNLSFAQDKTDNSLHAISCDSNGHLDINVATLDPAADLATETTLSALNNKIEKGDGSLQTELQRIVSYGCYNNTDLRSVKVDMNGRTLVQVDAQRSNGSQLLIIPDATTGTSSTINMGTHKFIAFYGDTDNTTNTNIFIEYSQDQVNWYRGAGDNAKIIIVSATGNFYDEEHVTPPYVRISRPNTSGSTENLQLYYTRL